MTKAIKSPVLVDTCLLGRGLPSLDNHLINYLWPNEDVILPYVKGGIIKKANLDEILEIRNQNDWPRLDAGHLQKLTESPINGYLTASALMSLAAPHDLVVTAGIGGITGQRVSQDLVNIADKPLWFISSGFKDVIDAKASLEYLKAQGIRVLGWKSPAYEGFLFSGPGYKLDGAVDENNIHNIDFKDGKGILIFNPVPAYLKIKDSKLLALAAEQINMMQEKGIDFHPLINKFLDDHTGGYASLIQLIALIANINLAGQLKDAWEGKR